MTDSTVLRQPTADVELQALLRGLGEQPPTISSKYFYDARGARLFEQICELPEYYPTRCEMEIFDQALPAIAAQLGAQCQVIEPGSGEGIKTERLLAALDAPAAYVPIDVAAEQLQLAAAAMQARHPELQVQPHIGDFTQLQSLPEHAGAARRVFFFPGSTVGNFLPAQAAGMLRDWRALAGDDGALLIGVDLRKDPAIIEAAYNDSQGLTAEFNLNMLAHLNRRFGADFELPQWCHHALYEQGSGQVQMWLHACREQTVHIGGEPFVFAAGAGIRTEYSCKYAPDDFEALLATAGWSLRDRWFDSQGWFAVMLFTAA